jgi:BASS family bile acid:Na+ symporter
LAIETGIQNSGLGLILIFNFFGGLGGMALVAGWWGIWHIVSGLGLSFFWQYQPLPALSTESR